MDQDVLFARLSYRPPGSLLSPVLHKDNIHNGRGPLLSVVVPRRFTLCRFPQLPSICASPISTPTNSMSTQPGIEQDIPPEHDQPNIASIPPTWISTPPTPPPRMVRRSITLLTRPSSGISPSASFPASTPSPHVNGRYLTRRHSLPSLSLRPGTSPLTLFVPTRPASRNSCPDDTVGTTCSSQSTTPSLEDVEVMRRNKPIFHIPRRPSLESDGTSSPSLTSSPGPIHESMSARGGPPRQDFNRAEKAKDQFRKYHALKELLATEVGYLIDLRVFVTVYIRLLPTLSYRPQASFGRTPSSFTSSAWSTSSSHTPHATSLPSSASFSNSSVTSCANIKDSTTKTLSRCLFTNQEIKVLTRTVEEILQLHELFVREICAELGPLGFQIDSLCCSCSDVQKQELHNLDQAIRIMSAKFATGASRFASYEPFCVGHPEALELVRRAQAQYPVEWEAFEQHCSSLVHELELSHVKEFQNPEPSGLCDKSSSLTLPRKRSRAASLSSIDGPVRTIRSRTGNASAGTFLPLDEQRREKSARLAFDDYLIKPVQRICKYPLMLDQLKTRISVPVSSSFNVASEVDVIVESAAQAMRRVARSIDEARHQQDIAVRSSLITSRISFVSSAASQGSSQYSIPQSLTQGFLTSLGPCVLAGSLDVIYYHTLKPSATTIHVKYLGAFLYRGGFLILVKVQKGKIYEPKHWFPLSGFEVSDPEEDDATLPCSIRLASNQHHFELAAACQREKDAWLNTMRDSCKDKPPWINEPESSLESDGKVPSHLAGGPFELVSALPTIQSIPELLTNSEAHMSLGTLCDDFKQKKSDSVPRKPSPEPPSRRSSTASVKAIFSATNADSEMITLRRSSPAARARVDFGLVDVISQLCLNARSYASSRDEELFQVPKSKFTRSGFIRSQSGIGMAGMAKNRLTRHESVRIIRRKSFVDNSERLVTNKSSSTATIAVRRQTTNLSLTPLSTSDSRSTRSSPRSPGSPFLTLQSPVLTKSPSQSPTLLDTPVSGTLHWSDERLQLKPSRSLVSNVKGFFSSRSSSAGCLARSNGVSNAEPCTPKTRTSESIGDWARGTFHRRTRSVPDPDETFILPNIEKLPALDFGAPVTPDYEAHIQVLPSFDNSKSTLRSSRLSSSTLQPSVEMDTRIGTSKNISLLQRLKA